MKEIEVTPGLIIPAFQGPDNKVGIEASRHCPRGKVFLPDMMNYGYTQMSEGLEFMDEDGSVLCRVADKAQYEASAIAYRQFITIRRDTHCLIENLQEDSIW